MILKRIRIKPCDIYIDHSYQRPLDTKRIEAMAEDFHRERIGVPVCSKRKDGSFWCLDGQHRLALLKYVGLEEEPIFVEYWEELTHQREAQEFVELNSKGVNGRLPVTALQQFKARCEAGYPTEVSIAKIMNRLKLRFSTDKGGTTICAVQSVEWVHKHNDNLESVLVVLKDWGESQDGAVFDRNLIKGLSNFLHQYPAVDTRHLLNRLRTLAPTTTAVKIKRAQKDDMPQWAAACYVLRGIYNVKSRHKLNPLDWNNV